MSDDELKAFYQANPGRFPKPAAAASATPALMPAAGTIEEIREPWVKVSIVTPATYIGPLMELATNRRGAFQGMEYLDPQRVLGVSAVAGTSTPRISMYFQPSSFAALI